MAGLASGISAVFCPKKPRKSLYLNAFPRHLKFSTGKQGECKTECAVSGFGGAKFSTGKQGECKTWKMWLCRSGMKFSTGKQGECKTCSQWASSSSAKFSTGKQGECKTFGILNHSPNEKFSTGKQGECKIRTLFYVVLSFPISAWECVLPISAWRIPHRPNPRNLVVPNRRNLVVPKRRLGMRPAKRRLANLPTAPSSGRRARRASCRARNTRPSGVRRR